MYAYVKLVVCVWSENGQVFLVRSNNGSSAVLVCALLISFTTIADFL